MATPMAQLQQLRKWRASRDRDISIGTSILDLRRSLKKSNKQLSQLLDAWDEVVPTYLSQHSHPVSLCRGVLEISADGAPTAFQLKRLIRAGLLRELQLRCSGTLKQIHVRAEQMNRNPT